MESRWGSESLPFLFQNIFRHKQQPDPSPGSGCRLSCIVCFYSAVLEDVEAVPVLLVDVVSVLPDVVLSDVVLSVAVLSVVVLSVVVPSVESVEALSTVIVYRSASVTSSFFQLDATLISLSFTHPSSVSLYLSDLRLEMIVCLLDSVLSSSNALSTRIT